MKGIIRLLSYRNTKNGRQNREEKWEYWMLNQTGWENDASKNERWEKRGEGREGGRSRGLGRKGGKIENIFLRRVGVEKGDWEEIT